MEIVRQLTELAQEGEDLGAARQVFNLLNARLFLGFHPVRGKKRTLNKINGGVVTFGNAPPPIEMYDGPTSCKKIKGPVGSVAAALVSGSRPHHQKAVLTPVVRGKSLGNIGRGERI